MTEREGWGVSKSSNCEMSDGRGVRKTVQTTLLEPSETISLGRSHLATWQSETFLCYRKNIKYKKIQFYQIGRFFCQLGYFSKNLVSIFLLGQLAALGYFAKNSLKPVLNRFSAYPF